ncbi:MAG: LruC domain-containing protein [Bacteroidales bacterium]
MKTLINKIKLLVAGLFVISTAATAQVTLNCESGNRAIEQGNCWGFGAVSYSRRDVHIISGFWSTLSNSMSNPSINSAWIKTPWMKMGSGDITMKVKLENNTGNTKQVVVTYIPYSAGAPYGEGTSNSFYTFNFPGTSGGYGMLTALQSLTIPIPSQIANDATTAYKIQISFVGTGGNNRAIADDIVIPGEYWSDPSNNCLPKAMIVDTDGDGVPDTSDQYPTDPNRAYNTYYPAAASSGTLAFEDNWPTKADYDFNDVVVDYNMNTVTNAQNQVVEILGQFTLKASGAAYKNGFGFQLDNIAPDKITSVTGANYSDASYISLAPNGLESNQTYANCIVFDNFYNIMAPVGGSVGVNTEKSAAFIPYQTLNVKITFIKDGVAPAGGTVLLSQLPASAFNFYVIADKQRGVEIHLPDRVPTTLANLSLLGTKDDSSVINSRYYKTVNNLPWAINILQGFKYPIEHSPLNNAYLHLIRWAESDGLEYQDWYEDKDGYRNPTEIY